MHLFECDTLYICENITVLMTDVEDETHYG